MRHTKTCIVYGVRRLKVTLIIRSVVLYRLTLYIKFELWKSYKNTIRALSDRVYFSLQVWFHKATTRFIWIFEVFQSKGFFLVFGQILIIQYGPTERVVCRGWKAIKISYLRHGFMYVLLIFTRSILHLPYLSVLYNLSP